MLLGARWIFEPSVAGMVAFVAVAALAILRVNRHHLNLEGTFPELSRVPLLRNLLCLERRP